MPALFKTGSQESPKINGNVRSLILGEGEMRGEMLLHAIIPASRVNGPGLR
jgi:hypothetical protein